MTRATGQLYRRIGLVLEAACMVGLLSVARGNVAFWSKLGLDPSLILSCGLLFGFLLWATGTYAIYANRGKPGRGTADD